MFLTMINLRWIFQQIKDRSGLNKSRRAFFLLILIGTLIFYFLSKFFPRRTHPTTIEYNPCLESRLKEYSIDEDRMDAIINHHPIRYNEVSSLPFIGNGYIALAFSTRSDLHLIAETQSTFLDTDYSPLIEIFLPGATESKATVLHFRQGFVEHLQCFRIDDRMSISLSNRIYAHRSRSSLLIQQVDLLNPTEQNIEIQLRRKTSKDFRSFSDEKLKNFRWKTSQINGLNLIIVHQEIPSKQVIQANGRFEEKFYTLVKFSSSLNFTELEETMKKEMLELLSSSVESLISEHRRLWASIWQSSFSISRSYAPSTLNGDAINRTIYYVLSSSPSAVAQSNETLFHIDRCYDSHSTLLGKRLWRSPGDLIAVSQLVNLWRSTLDKHGCRTLLRSGVEGVVQAMLLSIGAIRFRNHHAEIQLDPKELHRDLTFYSIHFGSRAHLNISIRVESDNRAGISVSIDQDQSQAYACDGGCIDPPKRLTRELTRFPVKMTDPLTAILYITEDFEYMTQLKDTLHVKEVEIAPPHSHNLLALHRHGHQFGGLPLIFWLILGFLIVIFHLFLLKIILNEMGFVKSSLPVYNSRTRIH